MTCKDRKNNPLSFLTLCRYPPELAAEGGRKGQDSKTKQVGAHIEYTYRHEAATPAVPVCDVTILKNFKVEPTV